jgi:hypothetical protein
MKLRAPYAHMPVSRACTVAVQHSITSDRQSPYCSSCRHTTPKNFALIPDVATVFHENFIQHISETHTRPAIRHERRLGGEELQPLCLDLVTRRVSIKPRPPFNCGEGTPGTHCTGGWVGPRAGLDAGGASVGDRTPVAQPVVSHYTDWSTGCPHFWHNYTKYVCTVRQTKYLTGTHSTGEIRMFSPTNGFPRNFVSAGQVHLTFGRMGPHSSDPS